MKRIIQFANYRWIDDPVNPSRSDSDLTSVPMVVDVGGVEIPDSEKLDSAWELISFTPAPGGLWFDDDRRTIIDLVKIPKELQSPKKEPRR